MSSDEIPFFPELEKEIGGRVSAGEISKDSPVFVYKSLWCAHNGSSLVEDDRTRFATFHADDVLYMEQNWRHHDTSLDSVELREFTCVTLKGGGPEGHLHIDVGFHEVMMRWMVWKERNNA